MSYLIFIITKTCNIWCENIQCKPIGGLEIDQHSYADQMLIIQVVISIDRDKSELIVYLAVVLEWGEKGDIKNKKVIGHG